jgi:hypothetical protein
MREDRSSVATYRLIDRALHRLALQAAPIAEMSFDIDQQLVGSDPKDIVEAPHVFVAGLARAGTTILMRRFYGTGAYRSLTYRDMPFVLAPNLWGRIAQSSRRTVAASERAHGDRILVDADSPESLDEVFWRVFAGAGYIGKTHLTPHEPDPETTWDYVRYVNAVLNAQAGQARRYLCKNNNNILRLGTIRAAFPRALILIPFRHPVAHAQSLLRQHRNFSQAQTEDPFVRSYMRWLVHHEFGLDHRPFQFDADGAARLARHVPDEIDYWLEMWCQTYGWLERTAPADAIFVSYEDLCRSEAVWRRLREMAGVEETGNPCETFSLRDTEAGPVANAALLDQASAIHARLEERARAALQ